MIAFLGRYILFFAVITWAAFSGNVSAETNDECMVCHSDRTLSTTKRGKVISLYVEEKRYAGSAHGELSCVSCHENYRPDELPHVPKAGRVDCRKCHSGEEFRGFESSVHGKVGTCTSCHTTHAIERITNGTISVRKQHAEVMCSRCHGEVDRRYKASDHGKALASGLPNAPTCFDCHDTHNVVSPTSEGAKTARKTEAAMCLHCHLDDKEVRSRMGPSAGFIERYEKSVHGQSIKDGGEGAATCSDCHGSHDMMRGSNPESKVAKGKIAATCGQCHSDVREQFEKSIHGNALARGISASATCTDCHGEHDILSPHDPRSPVAPANISSKVCSPCHSSVKLTEKYGLAGNRFQSFEDSYHGLAGRAGSVEVANCASCHGYHDILASTDSSSRVHKSNLAATCGTCHPGANENFARGSVHVIASAGDDDLLYFVSTAYILLIIVTIGGMFLHNVVDFLRKSRLQLMYRRGIIKRHHPGHRLYLRMTLNERIQHGILLVSFLLLVVTGFALRFPDAWWVASVRDLAPWTFDLRSLVHRIAGVLMVSVSLYHIWYLMTTPRGKQLLRDLLPRRKDLSDAIHVVKYNVGLTSVRPLLGRFSYIEKSEYWALVWGTIVMAMTGFILWFDNTFMGLLTKLWWDVARTVHYYEAWLATLAIIVWHFYFVIFNPHTYPINLAFWKGTLTEEEMEEEHPLELEEIKRRESLAAASEDPEEGKSAMEQAGKP